MVHEMPFIRSSSNKARSENIRREIAKVGESPHVQSVKQAVAIGYSMQRRAKQKEGRKVNHLDRDKVSKWSKGERKDYK
jgi:hypothetical protein